MKIAENHQRNFCWGLQRRENLHSGESKKISDPLSPRTLSKCDGWGQMVEWLPINSVRAELYIYNDWEGVESTDLDEEFSAAAAFVAATAADNAAQKVSNELLLQLYLYALYKNEGPCNAPEPSALKLNAHAKWRSSSALNMMIWMLIELCLFFNNV
ncbi:acyl- -binding domain-containing 1 [Olea europaea subsp. europaea]|uniref:Acyl- -binding domain-containing 1 n=1 Tax=Olea europaea subsp. europaea TaxID=158383 RepID=A0A8S0TFS8_OLEEU|nr:acyl- -binding domain-containing 1 [Olea europaea subsp. europaea]